MKVQRKELLRVCVISAVLSRLWVDVGSAHAPCFFIFGDSMSDNGNNNKNSTIARSDYRPYGIDFPTDSPSGRFTNGKNLADFIAKFLGFEDLIPPFSNTSGRDVLKGVNYASGAAGILDESGANLGNISSLNTQLQNHQITTEKIIQLLGNGTEEHLKKCMYMVAIGSNDYINNYFLPASIKLSSYQTLTPNDFATSLIQQYTLQLKALYNQFGARKVAIFGVGTIGCSPYARANFPTLGSLCVDKINSAIQIFNNGLRSLVDQLNANLPNASFTFIDLNHISLSLPFSAFMISDVPCCEVAPGGLQCIPFGKVCLNRNRYLFWDSIHPTQIAYAGISSRAINAFSTNEAYPLDINRLSQI